ncbi:TM2 domain-containing protein DDB_G0277895-like [Ptychodera flava]|uniref:TM2 domain-containing protein DDB_G0277895-like n=1 Tax=Ptychodera flava TaxID=63121 RepID=UPI00396A78AB
MGTLTTSQGSESRLLQAEVVDVPTKGVVEAYVLGLPLGWLGLHQFYLGRNGWGLLYLFTVGCLGFGWLVDLLRMYWLVKDVNRQLAEKAQGHNLPPTKKLSDAYILVIPFGWLGFHNFHLNRPGWGCIYMFTLGVLGVGWLIDIIRMPCLVKSVNRQIRKNHDHQQLPTTTPPTTTIYTTVNTAKTDFPTVPQGASSTYHVPPGYHGVTYQHGDGFQPRQDSAFYPPPYDSTVSANYGATATSQQPDCRHQSFDSAIYPDLNDGVNKKPVH